MATGITLAGLRALVDAARAAREALAFSPERRAELGEDSLEVRINDAVVSGGSLTVTPAEYQTLKRLLTDHPEISYEARLDLVPWPGIPVYIQQEKEIHE